MAGSDGVAEWDMLDTNHMTHDTKCDTNHMIHDTKCDTNHMCKCCASASVCPPLGEKTE